jgi:dienelactone hydrolase
LHRYGKALGISSGGFCLNKLILAFWCCNFDSHFPNQLLTIKLETMKKIAVGAILLVLSDSVLGQTNSLPKPDGKYSIGVTYLSFTDEKRIELFDNNLKNKREITVKVWYPADEKSTLEPYLRNADFAIKYCQLPETFRNLTTNSALNLPVSINSDKYPLLVFSHGWGEHYAQNTILMEELASHGYIVFSIAHHYECKYSEYPDGKTFHIEFGSLRFQKIMGEQQNPKAMELYRKMFDATSNEERMKVFYETSNLMSTLLKESPKYWAEDLSFFLDQINDINENNEILKGKLDVSKIGAFGMSMGGIATSDLCLYDKRIKAGISMDGGLYGSILEGKLNIPFMFLNSKRFTGYGNLFKEKSNKDCYALAISNADHYNFSDYSLYPSPNISFLLGTIDGKMALDITNVIVLSFFDKYLKLDKEIDLVKEATKYPEIEISSNLK